MNMSDVQYNILSAINRIVPKKKDTITIYGRKMLNDNAAALLDFLIKMRYNKKYSVNVVITSDVWHESYLNKENVHLKFGIWESFLSVLRSKYIFHTQGMSRLTMKPRKGQIIFNLWHGSPLKKIGRMLGDHTREDSFSYFLSASPFFEEINFQCFGHDVDQSFIGSNPRNDLLFERIDVSKVFSGMNSDVYIMFMPTFRKSELLNLQYEGIKFPLLTEDNISGLNAFLKNEGITLLVKPHPYQESIPLFRSRFSNIKIIKNQDLLNMRINLYSLIGSCDALITDFSSVYFDFMLVDKPIGFVTEDIGSYRENRGFTIDNPLDFMPGEKFSDINGFKDFVRSVKRHEDRYRSQRNKINDLCNTYKTPDACKRILDFVGIFK